MWVDEWERKITKSLQEHSLIELYTPKGQGVPLRVSLSMLLMEGLEFLGFALPCVLKLFYHCNDPVKAARTEFIELVSMKPFISDEINEIANDKVGWGMIGGSVLLHAKE